MIKNGVLVFILFGIIVDAGQICASCTDTEGRDTCQHHIECADEEVGAAYVILFFFSWQNVTN